MLYGQIQDRKDLLNILFYSLRCLPPKLANSIIINTNIKNGNIEKEQFIGYMTNCMNADGVDFISISDCEKAEYKPSHFYTMYLEWLMAPSDKTYYIIYGDNKEDRSGVGELETKLPEELDKKFNWSFRMRKEIKLVILPYKQANTLDWFLLPPL